MEKIRGFEWDKSNVNHIIQKHSIYPAEVESIFLKNYLVRRARKGRYIALGSTPDGKMLVAIFERKPRGYLRVITAYEMTAKQKSTYKRELQRRR